MVHFGIRSLWLGGAAGILMATLVAAIFGFVALRASGVYFLLVTLVLGELVFSAAWKWKSITGGSDGLSPIGYPDLGLSWFTWSTTSFYYFVLLAFVICFFLIYQIIRSPFGYALRGIQESESRMRCLGYDTWTYKYIAFILAGLFAGVAGVLYAYFNKIVVPSDSGVDTSAIAMIMVILGGAGTLGGPLIGAMLVILLGHFASIFIPERWPLVVGAAFIISVMYARGGISTYLMKFWKSVRV